MKITEFFRYWLGYEPSSGLAVQLIEVYGSRVESEHKQAARSR